MLSVLTDPQSFFAKRADDPSPLGPALVVLALALANAVGPLVRTVLVASRFGGDMTGIAAVGGVIGAVVSFFGPFVVWLLFGGSFVLLSYVFDPPESRPLPTLINSGWGFLPQVVTALIGAVLVIVVTATAVGSGGLRVPALVSIVPGVLSILTTLWGGYIWTHAVAETQDLTVRQGALCVAPAVLFGVLVAVGGVALAALGLAA